jgi:uncharacterized repeat protein (TIGR03803 family)
VRPLIVSRGVLFLAGVLSLAATLPAQTYKVLAYFNGMPASPEFPGLIAQSLGGSMLTTATDQTSDLHGVAFRVETSGALTVLHQFDPATGDLASSGLTLGRDGEFYGATMFGGIGDAGSVYRMTPDGTVTTLHEFTGGDESHPQAPPVESLYGDFYGTTSGDDSHPGAIYKIDSSGVYTLLHTFTGKDGSGPVAPLVQDPNNFWFYGAAADAGPSNVGTLFRISSTGQFQVLYNFDIAHGAYPVSLMRASDGNYYGAAYWGGNGSNGVIFKLALPDTVTVLHYFNGNDGSGPVGNLVQATDGKLYGTTPGGGAHGFGTLFRIDLATGALQVLYNFDLASGEAGVALIQHTDGYLYGDTSSGGTWNGTNYSGTFFRYDAGLSPFITYLDCYGRVGETVTVLGEGFTSGTVVLFNGVPAQVTEVEPTFLKVQVPLGATTGYLTATTTKGVLQSNKVFVVRP